MTADETEIIYDNEIWKEFNVTPLSKSKIEKTIWYVSNYGNIKKYNTYSKKMVTVKTYLSGGHINNRYKCISSNWGDKYVHRIVANAFIPNLHNKPQVDHIDRNKLNNHISNLRWVTNSENFKNKEPLKYTLKTTNLIYNL